MAQGFTRVLEGLRFSVPSVFKIARNRDMRMEKTKLKSILIVYGIMGPLAFAQSDSNEARSAHRK